MITNFKIYEADEILPAVGDWVALNPQNIGKQMHGMLKREAAQITKKTPKKSGGFQITVEFERKKGKEFGWRKSFPTGGTFVYLKTWILFWSSDKQEVEYFLKMNVEIDKYNL